MFSGVYAWPCRQWVLRARARSQSLRPRASSLVTTSKWLGLQHRVWWGHRGWAWLTCKFSGISPTRSLNTTR